MSRKWLLLVIPIFIISAPFLLMAVFAVSHLVGAILGPPAIWNRAWLTPSTPDLVGTYLESERHWDGAVAHSSATLRLNESGTMVVRNLPSEFGTETCMTAGTGQWRQRVGPADQRIDLIYKADEGIANVSL